MVDGVSSIAVVSALEVPAASGEGAGVDRALPLISLSVAALAASIGSRMSRNSRSSRLTARGARSIHWAAGSDSRAVAPAKAVIEAATTSSAASVRGRCQLQSNRTAGARVSATNIDNTSGTSKGRAQWAK